MQVRDTDDCMLDASMHAPQFAQHGYKIHRRGVNIQPKKRDAKGA